MAYIGIQDRVEEILRDYPPTRSDDRLLCWYVWEQLGRIKTIDGVEYISKEQFLAGPFEQTISRARRKVREEHPELGRGW